MKRDMVIAVVATLVVAVAWFIFWVEPRDEFLNAVMDCMEDGSQEAYAKCAETVRLNRE